MRTVIRVVRGVGQEFQAIWGVRDCLHDLYWRGYVLAWFVPFLFALIDRPFCVWLVGLWLARVGVGAVFPRMGVRTLRLLRLVRTPDATAVVRYLPRLHGILLIGLYIPALASLFLLIGHHYPTVLPVTNWREAWALTLDNLIRTELFFDVFESFHLALSGEPEGFAGQTILFLSRLLLNLAFARLVIEILVGAWGQATGRGSGDDALSRLREAVGVGDVREIQLHAGQLQQSLGAAVDDLARQAEGDRSEVAAARQGLGAMRPFALPYLRRRAAAAEDEGRSQRLADWLAGQEARGGDHPPGWRPGCWCC